MLAALAGLGLLAAMEGVLQLLDAGPSSRLFVESRRGGTVVYAANQRVGHRFFPPQYVRSVPANPSFPRYKSPDTVRIFVLGASTLLGFPNPASTSFPYFLERMLADVYADRQFEVINCGMTAINTFCLLDFMSEIVEYAPDLVIIYAGHNEFMGPYGVTTPFVRVGNQPDWIRLYMHLQRSRIHYYLREVIHRVQSRWGPAVTEAKFGPHLFSEEIGLLDEGYQTTVQNYRKNLEQMLLTARGHGVPVLLSTLVANLKDFYPLRSDCGRGDLSRELDLLVGQGRVREAVQLCEEELNETPYCASCHFELGRLHYLQGEYRKASKEFVYARDMDRLPFRAPTVFNRIIRRLAGAAEGQILLSDSGERFARASPHRIVGDELITEYLHPTVYGHYLIALNMVEVLAPDPVGRRWGKGDTDRVKNYDEYARQLGYSLRDRISHRNDLILFLRKMPYTAPPPVLRRRVAALIREQVEDVLQLNPAPYRDFVDRGGLVFLARMLDFLLPGDREALKSELEALERRI